MLRLLRSKINISFIADPFYLYFIAFALALITYLWGWSDMYPKLSFELILFLTISFIPFIFAGYFLEKNKNLIPELPQRSLPLKDIVFTIILFLGTLNVIIVGYIPILDRSHDYREFGAPVLDVLFNSMSIFFSVVFFQSFIEEKKKRYLVYFLVLLVIQIILFRRSTIVWILTSSVFYLIIFKKKVLFFLLILGIILLVPVFSYLFGLMGDTRNNFTRSDVVDNLGASQGFRKSGISYHYYMTYLYISSPLANLQKNIMPGDKFLINNRSVKDFIFYCIVPQSVTLRLGKKLNLFPPICRLINPELIVGSCFLISYCTLGWIGMISQLVFIFVYIIFCLALVRRWPTFYLTTISLLSTTVTLLIFDNILNRLDVMLMLFFYPVFFHFINLKSGKRAPHNNIT